MRKKFFLAFFLAVFATTFASVCPSQMIVGKGRGNDEEAADNKADIAIAQNIFSSIAVVSSDTLSSIEIDGVPADYSNFSETAKMESFLPNRQSVKQLKPHYKEDEEFVSERYICRSDAAEPWLASFGVEVAKYSNLANEIAEEKDSQKRNELRKAIPYIKKSIGSANAVLNPMVSEGVSEQTSQEYSKLKEDFKSAEKKIELSDKMAHDKNYGSGLRPLAPGWAQLYKGHYGRASFILASEAVLLAAGGISIGNYGDADRKYKDAVQKYNGSSNLNEKNELLQKSKGYKSNRESAEKIAFTSFLLAGVVYAYNIVDGYAATPAIARWHLAAIPLPSQNGIGTALAFTGNF
jgi:hypothetical protein